MARGRNRLDEHMRHERFARAAEAQRGSAATRSQDPDLDRDLAVVEMLHALGEETWDAEVTRERIARRIESTRTSTDSADIAATPTGPEPTGQEHRSEPARSVRSPRRALRTVPAPRAPHRSARTTGRRDSSARSSRTRIAGPAVSMVVGLALILALPVLILARDALPGDSLYRLKLASEQVEVGLSPDGEATARKHLELAAKRGRELSLLARQPDTAHDEYRATFERFTAEATEGTAALTPAATNSDGRQLRWLRSWADTQEDRLSTIAPRLPESTAPARAASLSLLDRIDTRAHLLWERMSCPRITTARTDDLGVLPAGTSCAGGGESGPHADPGAEPDAERDEQAAGAGSRQQVATDPGGSPPSSTPAHPEASAQTPGPSSMPAERPGERPGRPNVVPPEVSEPPGVSATPRAPDPTPPRSDEGITVPLPVEVGTVPPLAPGAPSVELG